MTGFWKWQWHQLDHMQTICTSLQTDNLTDLYNVRKTVAVVVISSENLFFQRI